MLTFEQGSKELHAKDRTIAKAIKTQSDGGDVFAKHIIDTYTTGTAGNTEDQNAFLVAYNAWRSANWPTLVAPIAAELGHPASNLSAEGTTSSTSLFADAPVATDVTPTPVAGPVPPGMDVPAAVATPAATTDDGRRKRVSWSQQEVVALSKMLLPLDAQHHPAAFIAFATANPKFSPTTVHEKAVELELTTVPLVTATPTTPQKPKLTHEDEAGILEAITEWILPEGMQKEIRLLRAEFAGKAIREFIKQING